LLFKQIAPSVSVINGYYGIQIIRHLILPVGV